MRLTADAKPVVFVLYVSMDQSHKPLNAKNKSLCELITSDGLAGGADGENDDNNSI